MDEKSKRGFASMTKEKRIAVSRLGGSNVPSAKRAFSRDPQLAVEAGRKGGLSVSPRKRAVAKAQTSA